MGNFEKLSVLVIGVIIVMILVVALYTWTDDPGADEAAGTVVREDAGLTAQAPSTSPPAERTEDPWRDWTDPTPDTPREAVVVTDRTEEKTTATVAEVVERGENETVVTTDAPQERTITVKAGDTLGAIALRELGSTKYWMAIRDRNDVDPLKIREGMTLIIPVIETAAVAPNKTGSTPVAAGAPKPGASYTVRKGDTIQRISQSAYKTIERWTDIWFANMERLEDPRVLPEGLTLEIPK